jgi:hypothetical protein
VSAEGAIRRQHARAALDGLHPSHWAGTPGPLLERARTSALGRRHLARAALRAQPRVLGPDHERWEPWALDEPWLAWPQADIDAFTHELGAIALGPAVRVTVERAEVLFLREALGLEAWRRAQAADPWGGPAPEAVRHMGRAVILRCGRDAQALREAVYERGKIEFLGHAGRRDARLAERLALAYATAPTLPCAKEAWLPAAAVPALLAARAPRPADGVDVPLEALPE